MIAKTLSVWLLMAGMLLGGVAGFVLSQVIAGDAGGAVSVLARALADQREAAASAPIWALAITASSALLMTALLPWAVIVALGHMQRRERNEERRITGHGHTQAVADTRSCDRRIGAAGRCRDVVEMVGDPPGIAGRRVRRLEGRLADHDCEG